MSEVEERIIQALKQEWKKMNKDQLIELLLYYVRPHTKPRSKNEGR